MACDLSILIKYYDSAEGTMKQVPVSLGVQVDENENVSIDRVVEAFITLPPDIRASIASQLATAKDLNITAKLLKDGLTVDEQKHTVQLVGNTTVGDLLKTYPGLAQSYKINPDLYNSYTIIRGKGGSNGNIRINNIGYNGRILTANGQEVFFITNRYDAEAFIKYLQTKDKAVEIFSNEEALPESVQPYIEDLKVIAKRKGLSMLDTVLGYLNNRDSFEPFIHQGSPITPRQVLGNIVSAISGEYSYDQARTDMELGISSLNVSEDKRFWELPKASLYDMLTIYDPTFGQQFSKENFRSMSATELNALFTGPNGLFVGHPKLGRAVVASETQGSKKVVMPDEPTTIKTKKLPKAVIKEAWAEVRRQAAEAGITLPEDYSEYEKLDPESMSKVFNQAKFQFTLEGSDTAVNITTRVVSDKNGRKRVEYNYEQEIANDPKVIESASYITLSFPYSLLGDVYHFGYNTQSIFSPVNEGVVKDGRYKSMFIFKAVIPTAKGTRDVYAISRSIISSKSSAASTYPTLEAAIKGADDKYAKDKIGANGLISIKQQIGLPREATIEMDEVQEGQILSTLDIQLPRVALKNMPNSLKQLLALTVPEFVQKLHDVQGIEKLDTPEKAAAFIIQAQQLFDRDAMKYLQSSKTITGALELISSPDYAEQVTELINNIDSAPMKHYYVEKLIVTKETERKSRSKLAILKYLNDGGTDINLEGTFVGDKTIDQFIGQTLDAAADFFNKTYGVAVNSMTATELEQFSIENNLGIEQKLAGIKAFVYNGQIYINSSNAKSSDLYHEISHIFLGVLKAQYEEGYQQIIKAYTSKGSFGRKFAYINENYTNFAEQDRVEEAVVDMIADELMRDSKLNVGFNEERFTEMIQNIINTVDSFKQDMVDSGLGFNDFMKTLMDKSAGKLKKQRILTEFVHQAIANKQISEVDC